MSAFGGQVPAPGEVRWIKKRNGRLVPWDKARVRDAVARAQAAVGEEDPAFAAEVADIVAYAVATRYAGAPGSAPGAVRGRVLDEASRGARGLAPVPDMAAPLSAELTPTVEAVQDLVERALIEMGRWRVAKAYILYRDRRRRARAALVVHEGEPALPRERPDVRGRMPLVREEAGTAVWNPGRIVAALMEEAELPRELAEEVAERVEARVFDAGLRRISTALVREFVDNELRSMGLDGGRLRQVSVAVARHDLRALLQRPRALTFLARDDWAPDDGGVAAEVGGRVLARFSLEDVLDDASAERHSRGEIFVEDLAHPHQALVRSVPAELFLRREPTARAPFELLGEAAPVLAECTFGLVIEGLGRLMDIGARTTQRGRGTLQGVLRSLGALARGTGRRLDLSAPGGRPGGVVELLRALAGLSAEGAPAPALFLEWDELAPALAADTDLAPRVEELLATGRLVPVWHGPGERWVAPGCRRRARESVALACGGAVCLHLPRLARRAGPWREERLFEELAGAVRSALDALASLAAFQRASRAARGEPLRERVGYALSPVGLGEALRILGDGEVRLEQGARLLGLLSDATRRFSAERSLGVVVAPFFGARARERFARRDLSEARAAQPRLFTDLPMPEEERAARYSAGYVLPASRPGSELGASLAALLSTVPSGALFPAFVSPAGARPALLAAWAELARRRDASREPAPAPRPLETEPLFRVTP